MELHELNLPERSEWFRNNFFLPSQGHVDKETRELVNPLEEIKNLIGSYDIQVTLRRANAARIPNEDFPFCRVHIANLAISHGLQQQTLAAIRSMPGLESDIHDFEKLIRSSRTDRHTL